MTRQEEKSSPAVIGEMYNRLTDSCAGALGGNLHVGYWSDENDRTSVTEATDRLTDLVAERLMLTPGQRVLDVGSGNGRPAARVASGHDVHVSGITLSEHQVQLGQARPEAGEGPGRADFRLADAMRLPFDDACFDAAYAIESIVHMEDPAAAFGEIARVLRPGGRLVVADWYLSGPLAGDDAAVVERFCRMFHVHFLTTADELREQADRAGLKIEEFEDIWPNISRSFSLVGEILPVSAAEVGGETGEELADCGEMYRCFGEIPQVSYVLFAALRR
ncbi:27-O-demethylrifamycin SV methyltransferase [Streptosporangium fragile]|uniref:27-O-demethylrifamycin SV methyltransferase n=1 Tax=Streptosporangium fragile TaxID=46186 RepID=A0ABN3VZF7_9ACTN